MIVIGITGGIAMGKTTVANQFAALGVPILDSDKVVHGLLAHDPGILAKIKKKFPEAVKNGKVDRKALGKEVFADDGKLKILEAILHPGVWAEQRRFLREQKRLRKPVAMLDIPLLFETGAEKRCDYTIAVFAPPLLQKQRALRREGMTAEKLDRILSRQMTHAHKRKKADFVVLTAAGKRESLRQVKAILRKICAK